jgi:hypothetical protein
VTTEIDRDLTPLEEAIESTFRRNFSRFFAPDFLVAFRRYFAKGGFVRTYSISVGTSPVQLIAFNPDRIRVSIFNNGNATVFYGRPRNVTTGPAGDPNAGFPLLTNTGMIITDNVGELWAVSGSAGMDVRIDDCTLESL